jgi:biopolymer transport protein TolQ
MTLGSFLIQIAGGGRASIPALIASSGVFGKTILVVLVAMSVYAWAVIWNRHRLFRQTEHADRDFLVAFRALGPHADCKLVCQQFPTSTLARVALAGQRALDRQGHAAAARDRHELTQHAMERAVNEESVRLERHVGYLGTTGSVTPFIGLMGTVWGIMSAFLNIGAQGSASLVVVAPGIAEALIATVAGLAAAIPAVIAYNHFVGRLRSMESRASQFAGEFLDRRAEAPAA